jgi:polyhydroxyalkanoate synthesis regulator phasin
MVKDALRGYLALASGVTEVTAARARSAARTLVEQGESTAGQVTALAEDLVATSRRNREGLLLIVRHEVEATLRRLGLGAAGDVDALNQRVRRLEQALREAERKAVGSDATSSPTTTNKQAAGKKSPARKKSPAKKAAARKSAVKRTAARKPAVKKSTAKKSAVRKSTAKRATVKKSAAKRSTAKKATGRKRAQKRATARKSSSSRRRS